jgi:hypothetical protein
MDVEDADPNEAVRVPNQTTLSRPATENDNETVKNAKIALGVAGACCMCCGIAFMSISIGIISWVNNNDFIPVLGNITQILVCDQSAQDGSILYTPEITYTTLDNETLVSETNICSDPLYKEVGDSIEIRYNPEDPLDIVTEGLLDGLRIGFTVLLVLCCICICGACGCCCYASTYRNEPNQHGSTTTTNHSTQQQPQQQSYGNSATAYTTQQPQHQSYGNSATTYTTQPVYSTSGAIISYK